MSARPLPLETGWNPALDVPTALAMVDEGVTALVSVLDSTAGVAALPSFVPLLRREQVDFAVVGTDVALACGGLLELAGREEVLTGFDEVWLCRDLPPAPKPPVLRITSDRPLEDVPPAALERWMRHAGMVAGLGDGDGLNFATFEAVFADRWREVWT